MEKYSTVSLLGRGSFGSVFIVKRLSDEVSFLCVWLLVLSFICCHTRFFSFLVYSEAICNEKDAIWSKSERERTLWLYVGCIFPRFLVPFTFYSCMFPSIGELEVRLLWQLGEDSLLLLVLMTFF